MTANVQCSARPRCTSSQRLEVVRLFNVRPVPMRLLTQRAHEAVHTREHRGPVDTLVTLVREETNEFRHVVAWQDQTSKRGRAGRPGPDDLDAESLTARRPVDRPACRRTPSGELRGAPLARRQPVARAIPIDRCPASIAAFYLADSSPQIRIGDPIARPRAVRSEPLLRALIERFGGTDGFEGSNKPLRPLGVCRRGAAARRRLPGSPSALLNRHRIERLEYVIDPSQEAPPDAHVADATRRDEGAKAPWLQAKDEVRRPVRHRGGSNGEGSGGASGPVVLFQSFISRSRS